jgi:hypothetical protein
MSNDTQEVETKADDTAAQTASTEETNSQAVETNEVDETTKTTAAESEPNEIDYKAELEAAQTRLSQAEHVIVETKQKLREAQTSTADVEVDYETTPTREELLTQLRAEQQSELSQFKKDLTQDIVNDEIERASSNPDEQALIKFHYENSIRQSGFSRAAIQADLESAKLLANKKRLIKENSELKEALKAKHSAGRVAGGSNQDPQVQEDELKLTPEEKALMQRHADKAGISLREYLRRNKKRLTNE